MQKATNGKPIKLEKLLRLRAVEDLTTLKKSTIYEGAKNGTFPAPVRLSARAVAWLESEISVWLSERQKSRGK